MRTTYGLDRPTALALPHWEFRHLAEGIRRHNSRRILDLFYCVSMATGGTKDGIAEYLQGLKARSGLSEAEAQQEQAKPKTTNKEGWQKMVNALFGG